MMLRHDPWQLNTQIDARAQPITYGAAAAVQNEVCGGAPLLMFQVSDIRHNGAINGREPARHTMVCAGIRDESV